METTTARKESLTAQQVAALAIARSMRLNIRLNAATARHNSHFHPIQCRLWQSVVAAGIPFSSVHGALQLLD